MARLTVLRTIEKSKLAAKTIHLSAEGKIDKIDFNAGTFFLQQVLDFASGL